MGKCICLHLVHVCIVVAIEKMDALLSSPTAWESQYKNIADIDTLKVPECGESFITLMSTITGQWPSATKVWRCTLCHMKLTCLINYMFMRKMVFLLIKTMFNLLNMVKNLPYKAIKWYNNPLKKTLMWIQSKKLSVMMRCILLSPLFLCSLEMTLVLKCIWIFILWQTVTSTSLPQSTGWNSSTCSLNCWKTSEFVLYKLWKRLPMILWATLSVQY